MAGVARGCLDTMPAFFTSPIVFVECKNTTTPLSHPTQRPSHPPSFALRREIRLQESRLRAHASQVPQVCWGSSPAPIARWPPALQRTSGWYGILAAPSWSISFSFFASKPFLPDLAPRPLRKSMSWIPVSFPHARNLIARAWKLQWKRLPII